MGARALGRMNLIQAFDLRSAFIGVLKLARILSRFLHGVGLHEAREVLHALAKIQYVALGVHRNAVEWYCGREEFVLPAPDAATLSDMRAPPAPMIDNAKIKADGDSGVDAIMANGLVSMGLGSGLGRTRRHSL